MRINIPDAKKPFVEKQMVKDGYKNPGEYFLSLVEQQRVRRRRDEIDELLLEALKEPASPMTQDDWDWVRREGRRMLARRKSR
jgi:antitoxin ParD1/3/4